MKLWNWVLAVTAAGAVQARALEVGQPAPDFAAPATSDAIIKLADFKGSWLVLYFYPKSFTPGCTKEACSLRDGYSEIQKLGVKILGASIDDVATQKRFKAEYKLPFDLLADKDKTVTKAYDVLALGGFMAQRKTFLINPEGQLAAIITDVKVSEHDKQVREAIEKLAKKE